MSEGTALQRPGPIRCSGLCLLGPWPSAQCALSFGHDDVRSAYIDWGGGSGTGRRCVLSFFALQD